THTITAAVVDARGKRASTTIRVTVDAPPTIQLATPTDGATFTRGTPVALSATATDTEDGPLSSRIQWTSDLDGALATGGTANVATLRVGTHHLTASVTDASGVNASAHVTIVVEPLLTLTIGGPAPGATFVPGAPITLVATATDSEDGTLTGAIQWSSDLDGTLGTGGTVVASTLRSGAHTLTASVTDSHGKTAMGHVAILVNAPPTITITAPADPASFVPGEVVALRASAHDLEDGALDAA